MAFTGKWKRTGSENDVAILVKMGMPKEVAGGLKDLESFIEIKQDGNTIEEVYIVGTNSTRTVVKIGETTQLTTWNQEKIDHVDMDNGAVVGKFIYTKC